MPQARDEAGNIWETDEQGNPLRLVSQGGRGGQVFTLPNSRQDADDQRKAEDQVMERERLRMAREAARRAQQAQSNSDAVAQRVRTQNPISEQDQKFINALRQQQGDLGGVLRDITAAQEAVDAFQPSAGRGALYAAGTPEDGDWLPTVAAKGAVGMFLPDEQQENYQRLARMQNQGVLNAQLAQKGPQTESDAARMKLAGVSPNKSVANNAQLLAEQQYDVMMKQNLPGFYTTWANRLGSINAPNSQGQTADDVWNEQYRRGLSRMRSDPGYRRATGSNKYRKAGDALRGDGGWKVERIDD